MLYKSLGWFLDGYVLKVLTQFINLIFVCPTVLVPSLCEHDDAATYKFNGESVPTVSFDRTNYFTICGIYLCGITKLDKPLL